MANHPEALAIAIRHQQAGRLHAAETICQEILTADPNRPDALNLLGIIAAQMGKHQDAAQYFSRTIALVGTQASFHNNLGNALKAQSKLDEAIACFQRAVELEPNFAEAHSNLGGAFKAQGKLVQAIAAYRRALELKPTAAEIHNNLGTVFQAQGKLDDAVASYQRAVNLKPDYALAYMNLANALQAQRKFEQAVACCHQALQRNPNLAETHLILGTALQAQGNLEQAVACFRRALELNPRLSAAHNNLGNALNNLGQLDEAVACFARALELKPDYPEAHTNLANALQQLGRFEDAQSSYAKALDLKADFAHAHVGQGTLKLLTGDWKNGWPEYEWRWATNEIVPRRFLQLRWNGDPLHGRTILLHAEQGFGDTIQFVRYAAVIKKENNAATVIVECQRPLAKLLASCPFIDRLVSQGDVLPPFDVHAPLLSVPRILKTSIDTVPSKIPYLWADPQLVDRWRERLSSVKGLRIGIHWRGRSLTRRRDIPIDCFRSLAELPGVRLISLQKGATRDELAVVTGSGHTIVDLGDFDTAHGAFMDTAAVMMNLDLVVTSDTAVPHLAGALGVPVWTALPFVPDWRWLLDRTDSPWYPTMRLFRQRQPGDWTTVFEEVTAALRQML